MYDAVTLTASLTVNLNILSARLHAPDNMDVLLRRFQSGAFESLLLAIDGMCDTREIDEQILKPCMDLPENAGEDVPPPSRVAYLMAHAVSVLPMKMKDNVDEIIADALSGQSVLLCEGCACACVMDTRGFEKRTIGKPEAERVVLGPHESFSESIRTNITLIRRIVQRETLITEFISVGGQMKTRCALLYLRGTADETLLARIRKRLYAASYDFAMTTGEVEQLIEDHPLSLIPQCVRTERPDRAASFLAEGQIILLTDGSPAALGTPATLLHQLHTPDDTAMRWQYGTFLRIVRMLGVAIHVLLPGLYLALLRFHQELFSPMMLTSVYETGSRVPIPVFLEALLMTLAFDLISEAGLRAPGTLGNALGIVSGLILGQSAVSADIVSPLLLIVVAASGLGGFCIPNYALSIGLKLVQLLVLCAGAAGGLYLIALVLLALLCALCRMQSVGSPLTAPITPPRPGNPDLFLRLPLRFQRAKAFFARQNTEKKRAQRIRACYRVRAAAAGFGVGAMTYAVGTLAATPLCLNAAWLCALSVLPACALLGWLARRSLAKAAPSRACAAFIAFFLGACALLLSFALMSLAKATLLPRARGSFIAQITALFLLLSSLAGQKGVMRAAFSLRYILCGGLLLLSLKSFSFETAAGLFPLLGRGADATLLGALFMLAASLPALLIALPPPELADLPPDEKQDGVPGAGFFILRLLFGALTGIFLLCGLSLRGTYEGLAAQRIWGERMRISSAPHEGGVSTLLALFQLLALALAALCLLLGAIAAARCALKRGEEKA